MFKKPLFKETKIMIINKLIMLINKRMDLEISNTKKVTVEYRVWILLIPIIMIIIGTIIFNVMGSQNSAIALLGGILILIGVLTFGILLITVIGLKFAARSLSVKSESSISFREKMKSEEQFPDQEIKDSTK